MVLTVTRVRLHLTMAAVKQSGRSGRAFATSTAIRSIPHLDNGATGPVDDRVIRSIQPNVLSRGQKCKLVQRGTSIPGDLLDCARPKIEGT